jgi:hypothetical protein
MKPLFFALSLAFAPLGALAASDAPAQARPAAETAVIQVNGLVCDFCAQSLEKVLGR